MLINKDVVKFIDLDEQSLSIIVHFIDGKSISIKYGTLKEYDSKVNQLKMTMSINL